MDIQILVSIIGLSGAAIISSLAYLYKSRVESKRSARKVLYYLLEIRYAISTMRTDPKSIYEQYISNCFQALSKRGFVASREEIEPSIGPYVYNHLVNITDAIKTEIDETFVIPYEQSLLELAETDPILAYKLRGKERIQEAIAHTTKYSNTMENELLPSLPATTDDINNALKKFSSSQKDEALEDIDRHFNAQILMVAKNCGIVDYFKCKKTLKKPVDQTRNIDTSDIDNAIDKLLELLTTEMAKAKAQPVTGDGVA